MTRCEAIPGQRRNGKARWVCSGNCNSCAYVAGPLPTEEILPLMRLRYSGYAASCGFASYLASKNGYELAALPKGQFAGPPEDVLDCDCDISQLGGPAAWT